MDDNEAKLALITEQLRQKIWSKYQTGIFFAGFSATILAMEAGFLWDRDTPPPDLLFASIAGLGAALVLFVAAIIKYDELTMPRAFWHASPIVTSVPLDFAHAKERDIAKLYNAMVYYWWRLLVPGMVLEAAALLIILAPAEIGEWFGNNKALLAALAGVVALAAAAYAWSISSKYRVADD